MSFSDDLKKFRRNTVRRTDLLVRKVIIDMGSRIVYRTPVGNPSLWQSNPPEGYVGGRARANWQYGNGSMPEGALDLIDSNGNPTLAAITAGVRSFEAASVHWVVNNLPYIERLENGWSTQAPQGMVGLTVVEFKGVVEIMARELN